MDKRKLLATLLRNLALCIESSSTEDIDALLAGERRLQIGPFAPGQTQPAKPKPRAPIPTRDWLAIEEKLKTLRSREEGQKLIEELALKRTELEHLARVINLPVSREDNVERLRQKIIESSIGSRLVSHAIRGE
ncbi:MAG: hypothetical protein DMG21_14400 [Acidobacteria bacterium]|nr:MAG: hypothetical protein DMG21_14400 [Acidobacteriota bacterium]